MISTESIPFDPYFLLIVWIGSLVAGLYLGVFRSLIDRIRAGLSTLPADESKSAKLLESLLSQPSHTRPFFTESGFFSALQIVSSFSSGNSSTPLFAEVLKEASSFSRNNESG